MLNHNTKYTVDSPLAYILNKRRILIYLKGEMTSIHAAYIDEVHDMPMSVIIRPFPPEVDEKKVLSLMDTLSNTETIDQVPPIDVLWITGKTFLNAILGLS